jgi:hypothetical protein
MTPTARETREFVTPGGHKVVLNSYLTGREAQTLKSIMFSSLKVNMDDAQSGKVGIGEMPSGFLVEQEKHALAFLIVSVDGDITTPIEKLLDLPSAEYDAVVKEINKIQNPTTPEKSAQPGTDTSQAA